MPPLVDLSNAVIGSTKCERIEWPASRARVFTLEFFYKEIIVGMWFFFVTTEVRKGMKGCMEEGTVDIRSDPCKVKNDLIMPHIYSCNYH